jgi:CPA1 family monovalent cation:H+ antiporter
VLIRALDRRAIQRTRRVSWRQRTVSSWAGFRGAVSLAAALAVPATTHNGSPFPDRSLIIFVTSFVILVTVLIQGSTLPAVVRWARLPDDTAHADELQLARSRSAQAALDALPTVAARLGVDQQLLNRLRKEYQEHAAFAEASAGASDAAERNDLLRRVRLGVLEHKRRAVTDLRDQDRIDDIVLREVQSAMDLEEARLLGPVDTG